jgi:2-polyprenyl-6-methoxyphenol hydroxylase-like FAD-dependent oxidoreductase
MALEDAQTLALVLQIMSETNSIESAIEMYHRLRRGRTQWIARLGRATELMPRNAVAAVLYATNRLEFLSKFAFICSGST